VVGNPFAGLSVPDLLRDGAALLFLFGALALPWDGAHDGSGRWWVVIAVIISAASLAIPYVVAAGVIPGWGGAQVSLAKLACAAPLAVSVVAAVVNELIHVNDEGLAFAFVPGIGGLGLPGIIGAGVGVALAGALFSAQPRAIEDVPSNSTLALWRPLAIWLIGIGAVMLAVTTLIGFATNVGDSGVDSVAQLIGILLMAQIATVVVVLLPLLPTVSGSLEWARVLGTVGVVVILVQFFTGASDNPLFLGLGFERLKDGAGVFLIAGGAAGVLARPWSTFLRSLDPVESWVRTAANACALASAGLAVSAMGRVLVMIGGDVTANDVVVVVVMLLAAAAFLAARALIGSNADQSRPVVVGILGGILLAAIVAIAVGRSSDTSDYVMTAEAVAWFGMTGLALWSLLAPAPIRAAFRPLGGTAPGGPGASLPTG
jgi:hypothetical protein